VNFLSNYLVALHYKGAVKFMARTGGKKLMFLSEWLEFP